MKYLLSIIFCLSLLDLCATHIVGGDVYYTSSNDTLYVTMILYRDCDPNNPGAALDNPAPISMFDATGNLVQTINVPLASSTFLDFDNSDSCLVNPPQICIEKGTYTTFFIMPDETQGYTVVYQRCCRNGNIQNLADPSNEGITITATYPGTNLAQGHNASPVFVDDPPIVICNNFNSSIPQRATDADGDSLVYGMCTPFDGGNTSSIDPTALPGPPPYNTTAWAPGYSANNQIDGNPTFFIHPVTGIISGIPSTVGFYAIGICVKEYRNGVLIGEIKRDFMYVVSNCTPLYDANFALPDECTGKSIDFINNSTGSSSNYFWDYGDGETATSAIGTHAYNDYGEYTITLIAGANTSCGDTAILDYKVGPSMTVDEIDYEQPCFIENKFNFLADGDYKPNEVEYDWRFSGGANPSQLDTETAFGITFPAYSNYEAEFAVIEPKSGCEANLTIELEVVDPKIVEIIPNVFTPNNDRINDGFYISRQDIDQYSITIFDRWGKEVFTCESNNVMDCIWNGTDKSEGVYYYYAQAINCKGELIYPETLRGTISLLK
jgi:gliding motility-associated-like protein